MGSPFVPAIPWIRVVLDGLALTICGVSSAGCIRFFEVYPDHPVLAGVGALVNGAVLWAALRRCFAWVVWVRRRDSIGVERERAYQEMEARLEETRRRERTARMN